MFSIRLLISVFAIISLFSVQIIAVGIAPKALAQYADPTASPEPTPDPNAGRPAEAFSQGMVHCSCDCTIPGCESIHVEYDSMDSATCQSECQQMADAQCTQTSGGMEGTTEP